MYLSNGITPQTSGSQTGVRETIFWGLRSTFQKKSTRRSWRKKFCV